MSNLGKRTSMNPDCLVPKNPLNTVLMIALFLGLPLMLVGGLFWGNSNHTATTGYMQPRMDGIINADWNSADYTIQKYMMVNQSFNPTCNSSDVNGFNYLYVGHNSTDLLIANDLVSDQTNITTDDQWFAVFLNTLDRKFGANMTENDTNYDDWIAVNEWFPNQFYDWRNNGTESLIINMTTKQILPMYWYDGVGYVEAKQIENITKSDVNVTYGHPYPTQEDWTKTYVKDGHPNQYTLESDNWGDGGNVYERIAFNVTIHLDKYFTGYPVGYEREFYSKITNMRINLNTFVQFSNSHYFDPANDFFDYAKVVVENNGTESVNLELGNRIDSTIYISPSAYTDGTIQLYFNLYNRTTIAPLTWYGIDFMDFECNIPNRYDVVYGSSTILNFTFASSFGVSPNSDIPHQMIEIAIPLIYLEGYRESTGIGVYVQGNLIGNKLLDPYFPLMHQYVIPTFWYGSNEQYAQVIFFVDRVSFYTPASPDWYMNYMKLKLEHKSVSF